MKEVCHSTMKKHRIMLVVTFVLLTGQLAHNIVFAMWTRPHAIAYDQRMTIDGESYVSGGRRLVEDGLIEGILQGDMCHSAPQQIVVGLFFELFGERFRPIRLFLIACHFAAVVLVLLLAWRLSKDAFVACGSSLAIGFSPALMAYSATLQYEPVVTMLIAATLYCALSERRVSHAIAGVLAAVLCMFRLHYLAVPFGILAGYLIGGCCPRAKRREVARRAGLFATALVVVSTVWCVAASLGQERPVVFHVACRANVFTHMNDNGHAYPYRDVVPPRGLEMVRSETQQYLWLVGKRLDVLWGFERDIWSTPVPLESTFRTDNQSTVDIYGTLFKAAFLITFLLGLAYAFIGRREGCEFRARCVMLVSPVIAPVGLALVMSMSPRYLVTALPAIAVFQMIALRAVAGFVIRTKGRSHPQSRDS